MTSQRDKQPPNEDKCPQRYIEKMENKGKKTRQSKEWWGVRSSKLNATGSQSVHIKLTKSYLKQQHSRTPLMGQVESPADHHYIKPCTPTTQVMAENTPSIIADSKAISNHGCPGNPFLPTNKQCTKIFHSPLRTNGTSNQAGRTTPHGQGDSANSQNDPQPNKQFTFQYQQACKC